MTQILELLDQEFKIIVINMLTALMEKTGQFLKTKEVT